MSIVAYNIYQPYSGKLGNIMFQTAATIATSLYYEMECFNPKKECFDYFKMGEIFSNIQASKDNNFLDYQEPSFNYNRIIIDKNKNYNLKGYFQSEKYFKEYAGFIRFMFEFKNSIKNKIYEKYSKILNEKTVSIHLRRGDYLKYPDHHPVLPLEYYNKAVSMFDKNHHFLVFSDDTEYVKKHFIASNFTIVEGNNEAEDMFLMSICDHNIICNSTYSWWASWLNKNKNKKIIAPPKNKWFGNSYSHWSVDDLYCDNWTVINF